MHVGIAGIGKMGAAIGSRLLSLGMPVTVWNRTAERARPLLDTGAQWAESPKALAESVDVVITLLTNEAALDDVYGSSSGLLAGQVRSPCQAARNGPACASGSSPFSGVSGRR